MHKYGLLGLVALLLLAFQPTDAAPMFAAASVGASHSSAYANPNSWATSKNAYNGPVHGTFLEEYDFGGPDEHVQKLIRGGKTHGSYMYKVGGNYRQSPLHQAVLLNDVERVKTLITDEHADLKLRNLDGYTAKELAENFYLHDIVKLIKIFERQKRKDRLKRLFKWRKQ